MRDPCTVRALAAFRRQFGREPQAGGLAPGRVNLIGDHTDYCGGLALPVALDLRCAVFVARSGKAAVEALADDLGESATVTIGSLTSTSGDGARPAWTNYAPAAAACALAMLSDRDGGPSKELPGLQMAISSDIPPGAGLGSSAAVEVAAFTAVEALVGRRVDPLHKAEACRRVEHEQAGCPCGLMDQLTAVSAVEGSALLFDFSDDRPLTRAIALPAAQDAAFLLIPTGAVHDNTSGAYARVRDRADEAARRLGLSGAADLSSDACRTALGAVELDEAHRHAVCHVLEENDRVLRFAEALSGSESAARHLSAAGRLMDQGHASLSDWMGTSLPEIDALAARCRAIHGVHGCRMTGAGWGGYLVALVAADGGPVVARTLGLPFHADHRASPGAAGVTLIRPSGGCREIHP